MRRAIFALTLVALAGSAHAELVELGPPAPFAAPPLAPAPAADNTAPAAPAALSPTNAELLAQA